VTPETVVGWIRSGELRAFNLAAKSARRPRYKVSADDLNLFLAGRTVVVPATRARLRTAKRQPNADYIEYV
jgi:hypothetical protein